MKQLLAILGITALVWLGVVMSEEGEYEVVARVEVTGYDTLRYAVVRADTALTLKVRATGYAAFLHSLSAKPLYLQVEMKEVDGSKAMAVEQLVGEVRRGMLGAVLLDAGTDSVRVVFARRGSRKYVPRLSGVQFLFADSYGLYGEPIVEPAEVELYGAEEVLEHIEEVSVVDTTIAGIHESGWYTLPLKAVWGKEVDVRVSCVEVRVYVPVEAYVERQYVVPITVMGADTSVSVKLYPSQVTVNAWITQHDIHHMPQMTVALDYADIERSPNKVAPSVVQYPSYMRLRSVEPAEVQCVIIK